MSKFMPIMTAIIALVGVALGAGLQHFLTIRLERQRQLLTLRTGAYTTFFKGQSKLQESMQLMHAGYDQEAQQLRHEYTVLVKEANFGIGIFGTKPVVDALVGLFGTHYGYEPCPGPAQRWRDDIKIYQQMRQEIFEGDARQNVDDNTLLQLLFRCTMPQEPR